LLINRSQIILKTYSRSPIEFLLNRIPKETSIADKRRNITHLGLVSSHVNDENSRFLIQRIEIDTKREKIIVKPLTVEEVTWLINELSAWLKLPIEVRHL
jgi:hypothetical protein